MELFVGNTFFQLIQLIGILLAAFAILFAVIRFYEQLLEYLDPTESSRQEREQQGKE